MSLVSGRAPVDLIAIGFNADGRREVLLGWHSRDILDGACGSIWGVVLVPIGLIIEANLKTQKSQD
jgi:hypothetical protein